MHFAYYDESGDDGYPQYSSVLFVLTALYLHFSEWASVLDQLIAFRREMKADYGLPVKIEFHANSFLKKKRPFVGYGLSNDDRCNIISHYCDAIASLKAKVINVCIVKDKIRSENYPVLDTALKYSIQRVHNDLCRENPDQRFLIITDEGRHVMMSRTARQIRRFNYVQSQYGGSREIPIGTLLEDPLPKESERSFFVQAADLVAFVTYLYSCHETGNAQRIARRLRYVPRSLVMEWMERLKPALNVRASGSDPYGVVFYPK